MKMIWIENNGASGEDNGGAHTWNKLIIIGKIMHDNLLPDNGIKVKYYSFCTGESG